jgi:molybdenum cofactor synthesis domain-containing protein
MEIMQKGFYRRTSVDEALRLLLSKVHLLDTETINFSDALGRVLAEDVASNNDNPPFDRAAMDGYAVKAENTFGASQTNPIYFDVVGEVSVGTQPKIEIKNFQAIKIMTGAAIPNGADAVVMFEYVKERGKKIEVLKPVTPGKNVSLKGEDVRKGEVLLRKGREIKPHDIGMLAAIGKTKIKVYRKPLVGIISSGEELIKPGTKLEKGKIYDVNTYSLSALVESTGARSIRLGIVSDEREKMKKAIKKALRHDAIILSGATSVGKKDIFPDIVEEMGKVLVHGVAMRPGEPTGFGMIEEKLVFMLPGYPVASIVGFSVFVRPALEKMQGKERRRMQVKAVLERKIASELGRRDFVRVKIKKEKGKLVASPVRTTGSGIISSLVKADGFVVVPENTEGLEKGKEVKVDLF